MVDNHKCVLSSSRLLSSEGFLVIPWNSLRMRAAQAWIRNGWNECGLTSATISIAQLQLVSNHG